MTAYLSIRGARQNNLKNISLDIPKNCLVAITGVSGSGKSSLAYDTLFAEAQRLFLENLSFSTRQFLEHLRRPDVDSIEGLSPALAVRQSAIRTSVRSTVGTYTDIYDFLRILYARYATVWCAAEGGALRAESAASLARKLIQSPEGTRLYILAPLPLPDEAQREQWLASIIAQGFTRAFLDEEEILLEEIGQEALASAKRFSLVLDRIIVRAAITQRLEEAIALAYSLANGQVQVLRQEEGKEREQACYTERIHCQRCGLTSGILTPGMFSFNTPQGACPACGGSGLSGDGLLGARCEAEAEGDSGTCVICSGSRLALPARITRLGSLPIVEALQLPISALVPRLVSLAEEEAFDQQAVALIADIQKRATILISLGLGELALGRALSSLSTGQLQRLQLASKLGSELTGVLYIFDELSTGLHPQEVLLVVSALRQLVAQGNSVLVIDHDLDVIKAADAIVEMGEGAGEAGGRVLAIFSQDTEDSLPESKILPYLRGERSLLWVRERNVDSKQSLTVKQSHGGAGCFTNLQIPLGALSVITGRSGQGKTRFLQEQLLPWVRELIRTKSSGGIQSVIDFSDAGAAVVARSVPATIVGVYDALRDLYASLPESKARGWGSGRFSFNVKGGRCEHCQGSGEHKVAAQFLPDLKGICEYCEGTRFTSTTLEIKFKGYTISEVLAMSVDQALPVFSAIPKIQRRLKTLAEIGLGYIRLGQSGETLSGGEVQRLRLAAELSRATKGQTLYVFDEPTAGLHPLDIALLLDIFQRLLHQGNTIVLAEHLPEIIASADWVIELVSDGVMQGHPREIEKNSASDIAPFLTAVYSGISPGNPN